MSRSMRHRRTFRTVVAFLGLIGLPSVGQASVVRYRCADGTTLRARFEAHQVDLEMKAGLVNLPQAMSADGGRYRGGDLTFWIKGRGADLTRGAVQTHCSVLP